MIIVQVFVRKDNIVYIKEQTIPLGMCIFCVGYAF